MASSAESKPPANEPRPTAPQESRAPAPESRAPAPESRAPAAGSRVATGAAKVAPKDAAARSSVGLSGVNELNLEKSIIRRGLATPQEVEACKAHRVKLATRLGPDAPARSLIDIMVEAKVLTRNQSLRLLKEAGSEGTGKFEIPGYQIIDRIGKGSMGLVFKAKQTSVDRIVAVKVLLDSLAENKEFIKRFEREAKIAAKLQHNNIVNAIDAGQVEGHHYFVMEYVEGGTVKDELDRIQVYEEKAALRVVLAVADAMKHAHERGLIHRDIKPENIMMTKDGQVKLADLGLARPIADEPWAMAEAGMAIGTPYYISPEQVRGQVDVDIRGDIYSLGATLYHMITGQVPYSGTTPQEVMRKHVDKNAHLDPPDHVNTRLSSGIGVVVETMMARNRDNRYNNPDDLILDLKCLLQGESPMIAGGKADSLAGLAEGDAHDDESEGVIGSPVAETERIEMAGIVNSRNTIIATLAAFLGLSMVTNLLMLVTK